MAWTEQLPSGRYRGNYRTATGQIRRAPGTFTHKAEALRKAGELEAGSRSLGWRDPQAAARSWSDWCDEWQQTRILAPSTARDERLAIKNHLRPQWGDTALIDITRHDIKAWAARLVSDGRAHATMKKLVAIFSASLSAAVDAEIITTNPAARLRLGTPDNTIEHYLNSEEQALLIAAHADHPLSRALTAVLIDCGPRWGEATALRANDIDLERRTIRIRAAWSEGELRPYTKSGRRRTVPLPLRAAHLLKTVMPKRPSALIFSYDGENPIDISSWRQDHHKPAVTAAELPHTRIHDLRHTYASTLLQAGISLAEVGKLMGHVSVLTTSRYAHLASTPSAAVLAALGDPTPIAGDGANVEQPPVADDRMESQSRGGEVIDFMAKRQMRNRI